MPETQSLCSGTQGQLPVVVYAVGDAHVAEAGASCCWTPWGQRTGTVALGRGCPLGAGEATSSQHHPGRGGQDRLGDGGAPGRACGGLWPWNLQRAEKSPPGAPGSAHLWDKGRGCPGCPGWCIRSLGPTPEKRLWPDFRVQGGLGVASPPPRAVWHEAGGGGPGCAGSSPPRPSLPVRVCLSRRPRDPAPDTHTLPAAWGFPSTLRHLSPSSQEVAVESVSKYRLWWPRRPVDSPSAGQPCHRLPRGPGRPAGLCVELLAEIMSTKGAQEPGPSAHLTQRGLGVAGAAGMTPRHTARRLSPRHRPTQSHPRGPLCRELTSGFSHKEVHREMPPLKEAGTPKHTH